MAAVQNNCAEKQRLLNSSSLKLAFQQAGAQRLVAMFSREFFFPLLQQNSERTFFYICTAFFHLASRSLVSSRFV
jgi:hypothetical protein